MRQPAIAGPGRKGVVDFKRIDHACDIRCGIPGFVRNPAIDREHLDPIALFIHRYGNDMRPDAIVIGGLGMGQRGRRDPLWHAGIPQERVEMAVFPGAFPLGMGVIIILGMGFPIDGITCGKMIPFIECALVAQQFRHDIAGRLAQHTLTVQHLLPRRQHAPQASL